MIYSFAEIVFDEERLEIRRGGELVKADPLVFDLLRFLLENRHRVLSKDDLVKAVWDGRFISDSAISSAIKHTRKAIGDTGRTQRFIKTIHGRGFRFIGDIETDEEEAREAIGSATPPIPEAPHQDVKFCQTSDGVSLAYSLVGTGLPVVKVATWMSHIEYDWRSPVWSHILHALTSETALLRYDQRGNGLSDWDVSEFSLNAFVSDLEHVIDAAGLDRVVLFGLSQGGAVACEYAARHPERVQGLILYGGYCRGWKNRNDPESEAQTKAILELARLGWGEDNPAFRQVFTSLFIPDGSIEQWHWYNDLQRSSTTGENAYLIDHALGEIDVTHRLKEVAAPALVAHCLNDAVIPYEEGRMVAKLLPDARFVSLPGRNHVPIETEEAWATLLPEIQAFLRSLQSS